MAAVNGATASNQLGRRPKVAGHAQRNAWPAARAGSRAHPDRRPDHTGMLAIAHRRWPQPAPGQVASTQQRQPPHIGTLQLPPVPSAEGTTPPARPAAQHATLRDRRRERRSRTPPPARSRATDFAASRSERGVGLARQPLDAASWARRPRPRRCRGADRSASRRWQARRQRRRDHVQWRRIDHLGSRWRPALPHHPSGRLPAHQPARQRVHSRRRPGSDPSQPCWCTSEHRRLRSFIRFSSDAAARTWASKLLCPGARRCRCGRSPAARRLCRGACRSARPSAAAAWRRAPRTRRRLTCWNSRRGRSCWQKGAAAPGPRRRRRCRSR